MSLKSVGPKPTKHFTGRITEERIQKAFKNVQSDERCAVENCRYELIHEDRYEEACTFITDHYCPEEPLSVNSGIVLNQDLVMKAMTIGDLQQNLSLALISCETDEMIGIQILTIAQKHKLNPDDFKNSEKARQLMSFVAYKDTVVNVFDYYDVDELFAIFELAVHRDHRRRGIGCKLMLAATIFVSRMDIGPCVIKGNAASNYSKRIFEKLNFDNIKEVKFEDYKVDGMQVITMQRLNQCWGGQLL